MTTTQHLGATGTIALPQAVIDGAFLLAAKDYQEAEEEEFSGDAVRDHLPPQDWLPDTMTVMPLAELRALGLEPGEAKTHHLYATCSVDEHIDDMDGLSVGVVIHSDGFTFKQGKTKLKLKTGDWFIFDDRLPHRADDSKHSTTLLLVTAPLKTC